jgi:hypothetical protein
VIAEPYAAGSSIVSNHAENDLRAGGSFRGRACDLGSGRIKGNGFFSVAIINSQGETRAEEPARHACAHDSKAAKSQVRF